jgi:hypothetical protein
MSCIPIERPSAPFSKDTLHSSADTLHSKPACSCPPPSRQTSPCSLATSPSNMASKLHYRRFVKQNLVLATFSAYLSLRTRVSLDWISSNNSHQTVSLLTARHNNSELYGAAQFELIASYSLLLSSTVSWSSRTDDGVELIVSTPHGKKLICAKKLLITIPPRLFYFRAFNLSPQETGVFAKLIDAGYYVALVRNTKIPDDLLINNYAQNTRLNLPEFSGVYLIQPTAIPGLKAIYYGSQRTNSTFLSDKTVKSAILKSIATL